jgi:hypothetical protein
LEIKTVSRKAKPKKWATKTKNLKKRFDYNKVEQIILDIVYRMELDNAVLQKLKKLKRLDPEIELGLHVEISYSTQILFGSIGLEKSYVMEIVKQMRANKAFQESVEKRVNEFLGGEKKFKLYTTEDLKTEAKADGKLKVAEKKIKEGGNILEL